MVRLLMVYYGTTSEFHCNQLAINGNKMLTLYHAEKDIHIIKRKRAMLLFPLMSSDLDVYQIEFYGDISLYVFVSI